MVRSASDLVAAFPLVSIFSRIRYEHEVGHIAYKCGSSACGCQQNSLRTRLEARAVRTASHHLVITYRSKEPSLSFVSTLAVDLMESVSFAARLFAGSH